MFKKPKIMGIAKSYEKQIVGLEQKDYPKQRELIQSFLEETWNPMEELDKLNRNMDMFIGYLFENKINFKILETLPKIGTTLSSSFLVLLK